MPDELSIDEPPAADADAVALVVASELAMNVTAPPAVIDCDVIAVALSVVTATPIAIPTAFVPAALPLDDVVAVSVCVAVEENAPVITSGLESAPTVAVALLFTIAIAAEIPIPVPSDAIAPFTAVVVSV